MPIIGKLLKKTTEITYKRKFKKGKEYTNQLNTLGKLLEKAKNTRFGLHHDFHKILNKSDFVEVYQEHVPITDYDTFYAAWLKESIRGNKDHTWPGRIKYYALSSGTTGSPSKRIPVTEEMIRSFQKTSMGQISALHELDLPDSFYSASILAVGGCSKLTKKKTHIEGDLSGILKKHTSFIVNPFTKPGNKIAGIRDWNKKLEKMVEKAPTWNVGILAGVPSWCILLLERIVERYELDSIHDIWPNFQVYVHGGVFMQPYISRLEKVAGKKVFLLDTYLASEGYFAYQESIDSTGMRLLLNNGVFYEFVPFNSEFFDENGTVRHGAKAFTLSEVTKGIDYAMVISTNAGLWRYMIGDLVRFEDIAEREVRITGRIKQFLSLCGEHLSLDNINTAINNISKQHGIQISEFSLYAGTDPTKHFWFIGTDHQVTEEDLRNALDRELAALNDDYAAVRKHTLQEPNLQVFPVSVFYEFMDSIGKSGSQNKVPRVMNEYQAEKWQKFLTKKGLS
ncbi:MAG: GH3 auxin-responsive promoter family protein [Flavobacteriia bacterium]